MFISKSDPEPVESVAEVQLGKELLTSKTVKKSGDERERVAVLDGNPI